MRSQLLVLLLLAPLWVLAQAPTKQERKVRTQLDRGHPYPAIRNATAMLMKGGHPEFLAMRAEGYNAIAEHANAAMDARASLKAFPGNTEGLLQLAIAQQGLGRLDSAALLLRQVLEASPSVDVYYRLAMVEQQGGRLDLAMAEIDRALAAGGADHAGAARLHRVKGEIAALSGDTAAARAELDRAVELAPADPANYNSRAYYIHAHNGDHRAAIKDYDRAIKLNPNYSYAFNNRGWSRYKLGDTAKAIKDIHRAKRRKVHNPYIYRNLGVIALETGDTAKACVLLRQALDKGFTALYGNEVEELIDASCGKVPVSAPPRTNMPDRPEEQQAVPRTNAPE